MGRKGVSKRKSSKQKNSATSGTHGTVSPVLVAAESRAPRTLGKGSAVSVGKGSKKKSSDS